MTSGVLNLIDDLDERDALLADLHFESAHIAKYLFILMVTRFGYLLIIDAHGAFSNLTPRFPVRFDQFGKKRIAPSG